MLEKLDFLLVDLRSVISRVGVVLILGVINDDCFAKSEHGDEINLRFINDKFSLFIGQINITSANKARIYLKSPLQPT